MRKEHLLAGVVLRLPFVRQTSHDTHAVDDMLGPLFRAGGACETWSFVQVEVSGTNHHLEKHAHPSDIEG